MEQDNHPIDYIKEFNQHFQEYSKSCSEMHLDFLNQSLAFLGSSKNLRQFDPDVSDTAKFYINLHSLLTNPESRYHIIWPALEVLQQVSRNNQARLSLVNKFKYIPILSKILSSEQTIDRKTRLLKLLQDLTYGIRIKWQEPHLSDLIKVLIKMIETSDDSTQKLCLSVLINLCYKNLPSLYLLSRTVNVTEFGSRIRKHGILACKMFLILETCFVDTDNENLQQFIKFTFVEIVNATRSSDTILIRHIVDFFIDMKHNENTKSVIYSYSNYMCDIKSMLESLASFKMVSPDIPNYYEQNVNTAVCFSTIFELLAEMLNFNIEPLYADLIEIILNWVNMDESCNKGLELLRKIIASFDSLPKNIDIVERISKLLPEVLFITFRLEIPIGSTSSLLQLLFDMVKKSSEIKFRVFEIINEDFFENLFDKIFSNFYLSETNQMSPNEVEMYMHGIHLLYESTNHLPNKFNCFIQKLFDSKTMQIIFSKCFISNNPKLSWIVFELAKNNNFPGACVAELIANQKPICHSDSKEINRVSSEISLDESMNYVNFSISQNIETKLNDTIDKVILIKNHTVNGGMPSSITEIIEMFEYKIMISQNSEKDLLVRLEQSNNELVNISQRCALLSAEISKFQNRNFLFHLTNEKLKETVSNFQKQVKQLKLENDQLKIKLITEAKNYRILNETKLKLTQDLCEMQKKVRTLENENELSTLKIDELKKLNASYKADCDQLNLDLERVIEMKNKLNEYESKLLDNTKEINNLLNVKLNLENNCKQLEMDLAEKNETILSYEMKLQEIDNMKNTVVQLMQLK